MEKDLCNRMCMLSEWDENKKRDCRSCSGNYSNAGAILLPQQIERMVAQYKGSSEHTEIGLSRIIRSKYSNTKHKRVPRKINRLVLLADFRLHRA